MNEFYSEMSIQDTESAKRQLIIKRDQIKNSLFRFGAYIDKCKTFLNENNILQLELRLTNSELLLQQFNNVQDDIELLDPEEIGSDERFAFENNYYELLQTAKSLIINHFSKKQSQTPINVSTNNVRFPPIDLPKFYGDYEKWGQFRDMFNTLVHSDSQLDDIKKFYYLISCVKGEAAQIIDNLEVTSENYQTAWDLLTTRYQNKSVIIKHHVASLFEVPNIGKDAYVGLRNLSNSLKKHLRSLETLGEPVKQWDTLLFYFITKKLDYATNKEWETLFISKHSQNEKVTFQDFLDFLDKRCILLESFQRKSEYKTDSKSLPKLYDQSKSKFLDKPFSGYVAQPKSILCNFCSGKHPLYICTRLLDMQVPQRLVEIKKLKLCENCLRSNHKTENCVSQGCKQCKQRHNTILHQNQDENRETTNTTAVSNSCTNSLPSTILATATILIQNLFGKWIKCRALLDSGSQPNFISKRMQSLLNITPTKIKTGHFIVQLPIKSHQPSLGESLQNAIKRQYSMERKFTKNETFKKQYTDFMHEYEMLGHMTAISKNDILTSKNVFYLPHHGVINESSTTTKLRVVFDGSCKTSSNVSLNDILKIGPTIQRDLFSILLNFRVHQVVLTGDLQKMYRQVYIDENQRDLQRIVWRFNENDELKHYRLNTVTYGTSSASFLAIRCLQHIATDQKELYPQISKIIANDFYVDDLLTGANTVEEAIFIKQNITVILEQYGFKLHKFMSNHPEVLGDSKEANTNNYQITENGITKILGLQWQASNDMLTYKLNKDELETKQITKRVILSLISKLFDPLGLLSPIIINAKILMQLLWQAKISWDEKPPDNILALWHTFQFSLQQTNNVYLPRQVIISATKEYELHGFCDASQKAYAACIYIKSKSSNGQVCSKLLCAKTKVAPLKTLTLPRLELCGAVLLSELYHKISQTIEIKFNRIVLWSDSTIVLSWVNSSPSLLKTFVANRIGGIQTLTSVCNWRHVPSEFNPADVASRGSDTKSLLKLSLWWNGPQWLIQDEKYWPKNIILSEPIEERRNEQISLITIKNQDSFELFSKYSNLNKLQRIISYILRFIKNCQNSSSKQNGLLSVNEINQSMLILVKLSQNESFSREIHCLKQAKPLPSDSRLLNLNPFLDPDGFLRVGGRLGNSNLPYESKHQLILSHQHKLVKLIIQNEHHRHLHAGCQTILAATRQQFWILNARSAIRNILNKCTTCFRVNPKLIQRKMASLPVERVTINRPFSIVGVDFAGPFNIKDGKSRKRTVLKSYLCVFVCFSTKAVHLELVSELSTQAFLKTLKRFVSRRGLCTRIYSDNGTNFVGANSEIKNTFKTVLNFINDAEISNWLLSNKISWLFNPPYSPHRGGLWEAAVRQAKYHLKRIVGTLILTFEDLYTVFAQIEAIMNSRPIHPLSQDPTDFDYLTPGHFLIGQSLSSLPETDITKVPDNRLKAYQMLQKAVQQFWKKWQMDYLNQLQQRTKWTKDSNFSMHIGSMVLIIDDHMCVKLATKMKH